MVDKLGWDNTDIFEWVTGAAMPDLKAWKTAILDDENELPDLNAAIGFPGGWNNLSAVLKLCSQKLLTVDPDTLNVVQLTARTAVSIAKESCADLRWQATYMTDAKHCCEIALQLIITVVNDLACRPVEGFFIKMLGGSMLPMVKQYNRRPEDKVAGLSKSTIPLPAKRKPAISNTGEESDEGGAPTRKRNRKAVVPNSKVDPDDGGPESVPAFAIRDTPASTNMLNATTHQDIQAQMYADRIKAQQAQERAEKDRQLYIKDAWQAVQQQRATERRNGDLQNENTRMRQLLQNNEIDDTVPQDDEQVFKDAASAIVKLASGDYAGTAQLIKNHSELSGILKKEFGQINIPSDAVEQLKSECANTIELAKKATEGYYAPDPVAHVQALSKVTRLQRELDLLKAKYEAVIATDRNASKDVGTEIQDAEAPTEGGCRGGRGSDPLSKKADAVIALPNDADAQANVAESTPSRAEDGLNGLKRQITDAAVTHSATGCLSDQRVENGEEEADRQAGRGRSVQLEETDAAATMTNVTDAGVCAAKSELCDAGERTSSLERQIAGARTTRPANENSLDQPVEIEDEETAEASVTHPDAQLDAPNTIHDLNSSDAVAVEMRNVETQTEGNCQSGRGCQISLDYAFSTMERANEAEAKYYAADTKLRKAEKKVENLKREVSDLKRVAIDATTAAQNIGCSADQPIEIGDNDEDDSADEDLASQIEDLEAHIATKDAMMSRQATTIRHLEADNEAKCQSNVDSRGFMGSVIGRQQDEIDRLKKKSGERVHR